VRAAREKKAAFRSAAQGCVRCDVADREILQYFHGLLDDNAAPAERATSFRRSDNLVLIAAEI
jgi:hypothetical protein